MRGFSFKTLFRFELLSSQVSSPVSYSSRSVDYEVTGTMIVP